MIPNPSVPLAAQARRVLPVLALAWTAGCLRAELRPTIPMVSHSEEVDTQVEALEVGRGRDFVLRMRSRAPHRIRRAHLTVATRLPCQGGLEPVAIAVDGIPGVAVAAGQHEVRAGFSRDEFSMDLVLDLELDEGRCVRTPVYSTSLAFEARSRPIVSLSFPTLANTDLQGLRGILALQVGIGKWFGHLRLLGELGAGLAFCGERVCGKDGNSNKSGLGIPITLQASYRAAQWELFNGTSVGLVGLRYSYLPVRLPTLAGDRSFAVHGVHGEVGWGITEALKGNLRSLERVEAVEFVIPVGVLIDQAGKVAFSGGIVVRFLVPI